MIGCKYVSVDDLLGTEGEDGAFGAMLGEKVIVHSNNSGFVRLNLINYPTRPIC